MTIRDICGRTFSQEKSVTIRDICGKHSQAACEGASHRLHRFTRILGAEEKDTNHTDVAQEKSVTIRDICGKTFSRKIRDNPWNLWENILSSSMRRSLPQITQIYTDIGCGGEGHESHGCSTRKKSVTIRGICGKIFSQAACGGVPTDYTDLHGYWVRRRRTRITRT